MSSDVVTQIGNAILAGSRPTTNHRCLGRYGYALNKSELTEAEMHDIERDLTVVTTVLPAYRDFQKPKKYKIYYHNEHQYFVPRYYGIEKFGPPAYIAMCPGNPINVNCPQEPLPHQQVAISKLQSIFDASKPAGDGGVLSLPCGYGKTFCAIKTVSCFLKLAALIVVPTECLMDQWVEAIGRFTGGTAKVGIIQQDKVEVAGRDFVVAMLHSLCLKEYPLETFRSFGIVIFDECHHISSETFRNAMMRIRTRFTLGLSATPERRDGLSQVFYQFLGPLFHRERRSGTNQVIIKKLLLYSNSEAYTKLTMSNGTTNTSGMITAIAAMPERNRLIIAALRVLMEQGRKVLLLSSRKGHLHEIHDMLAAAKFRRADGKTATFGFYYGKSGITKKAHRKILEESAKCDIVLGIDVIAKEGLDIPDINTLIFATPGGVAVEQPVGRILRKFHKDVNPYVIDLVDGTGNFPHHSKERDSWYREEEYIIQENEIELRPEGDEWVEGLCDFLNRNDIEPCCMKVARRRSKVAKRMAEPDFSVCALDVAVPVAAAKAPMSAVKAPMSTVKDGPDFGKCLLASAPATKTNKISSIDEPDLDKCLL